MTIKLAHSLHSLHKKSCKSFSMPNINVQLFAAINWNHWAV